MSESQPVLRWRKEPIGSAGGTSWRLVTGRRGDRVWLNLGRVTEAEAEAARRRLNTANRKTLEQLIEQAERTGLVRLAAYLRRKQVP